MLIFIYYLYIFVKNWVLMIKIVLKLGIRGNFFFFEDNFFSLLVNRSLDELK